MINNLDEDENLNKFTLAKPYKRFIAAIIDSLIIMTASILIIVPYFLLGFASNVTLLGNFDNVSKNLGLGYFILFLLLNWAYFASFETSKSGASVGKLIMKIKVVDYNQNRLTYGKTILRFIGKVISSTLLFTPYILILVSEKKQSLSDIFAKTYVIDNNNVAISYI